MARIQHVVTDRFLGRGDDGMRYEVIERTRVIDVAYLDGSRDRAFGLKSYRTFEGWPLNVRGDGTFELVGRSVTVRRL
jgi:hypothetical protein